MSTQARLKSQRRRGNAAGRRRWIRSLNANTRVVGKATLGQNISIVINSTVSIPIFPFGTTFLSAVRSGSDRFLVTFHTFNPRLLIEWVHAHEPIFSHDPLDTPKQIFRCDFPDCYRTFVRQDLCLRHRERHTTHGSQLQKRDNFTQAANNAAVSKSHYEVGSSPAEQLPRHGNTSVMSSPGRLTISTPTTSQRRQGSFPPNSVPSGQYSNMAYMQTQHPMHLTPDGTAHPLTPHTPYSGSDSGVRQSDHPASFTMSPGKVQAYSETTIKTIPPKSAYPATQHPSYQVSPFSPTESGGRSSSTTQAPTPTSNPAVMYGTSNGLSTSPALGNRTSMMSSQHSGSAAHLTQPGYAPPNFVPNSNVAYVTSALSALDSARASAPPGSSGSVDPHGNPSNPYPHPMFGGESYYRSPFGMGDDFTAWLFNDPSSGPNTATHPAMSGIAPSYHDPSQNVQPFYPSDVAYNHFYSNIIPQHPMSVTSILDSSPPEALMSEEKRQAILHLINTRFNVSAPSSIGIRKETLLGGNTTADGHVLSLRTMHIYIASYWYHFHAQIPILHKPTFVADKIPDLLLLAVIAIGAATLDKMYGESVTEKAAHFANFIGWHLRWEIFMDPDFLPPAKLWVFQALLLLEVYEKMYSTRTLHERGHIHHDTTLTLMRRGSSLVGKFAFDTPNSNYTLSSNGSDSGLGEDSWSHWVKNEATRRVAFAAFVMDSVHATMFGHSAKMVAHEMRLPLPCDEALWSATSAGEVARMQASLQSNGVKSIMFLDGLKKTLIGQKVRTSSFGRTVLMAGLLSVSWHMNQRDLQVSSLGVAQALGGRDKWKSALLRSYDNWKRDFDEAVAEHGSRPYSGRFRPQYPVDVDDVFESRVVLHHLAHMASHVDIVDCQIFAGAGRLLGRSITPRDYSTAREKMVDRWAPKASARDATFYALRFLHQVLLQPNNGPLGPGVCFQGAGYSAREDFLLNRSWVVYFATLIVWSYGFALEGPLRTVPDLRTTADQLRDMQHFLSIFGAVQDPKDLENMSGRNHCLGLLLILKDSFLQTRWELLHEAGSLLESCAQKLKTPAGP